MDDGVDVGCEPCSMTSHSSGDMFMRLNCYLQITMSNFIGSKRKLVDQTLSPGSKRHKGGENQTGLIVSYSSKVFINSIQGLSPMSGSFFFGLIEDILGLNH